MTNDIDLGARLRLAREAKGLRQEDVAKALEVSQQAVQSWEANRSTPRGLQRIAKLAELLGIEPSDIRDVPLVSEPKSEYETRRMVVDNLAQLVARRVDVVERPRIEGRPLTSAIRDERRAEFVDCLPEHLRPFAGGALDVRGMQYRFDYLSRKTVASILYAPLLHDMVSPASLRMALYRLAVAAKQYNDFPAPDHHYLQAVIPVTPGNAILPRSILHEARLFDVNLELHQNVASVCSRIVELESTKTELDELYEQTMNVEFDETQEPPPDFL